MARRNEHVSKQLNESTKPSKNQQHLNKNSQKRSKSTDQQHNPIKKPKKTANACLSCRNNVLVVHHVQIVKIKVYLVNTVNKRKK